MSAINVRKSWKNSCRNTKASKEHRSRHSNNGLIRACEVHCLNPVDKTTFSFIVKAPIVFCYSVVTDMLSFASCPLATDLAIILRVLDQVANSKDNRAACHQPQREHKRGYQLKPAKASSCQHSFIKFISFGCGIILGQFGSQQLAGLVSLAFVLLCDCC